MTWALYTSSVLVGFGAASKCFTYSWVGSLLTQGLLMKERFIKKIQFMSNLFREETRILVLEKYILLYSFGHKMGFSSL